MVIANRGIVGVDASNAKPQCPVRLSGKHLPFAAC